MKYIKCHQCGERYPASDYVCSHCGASNISATSNPETHFGPTDESKLEICDDCGGKISSRALSCPHCGAPSKINVKHKSDWGYEWRSKATIFGIPLVHIAVGRKNGRLRVAKGIVAIGQFGIGLFTIAQFGVGILFGFGQFLLASTAIAQFAISFLFGLGQIASGYIAIGQFGYGYYVLAQSGFGTHVWSTRIKDPIALEFFKNLAAWLGVG